MLTALKALLFLERRRLALVASLAFVAGSLFYWNSEVYLGSVHISVLTGFVYAIVVVITAIVVCGFIPSMRHMMESVAFSRLALAFVFLARPDLGGVLLANPLLLALVIVTGGACISRLIHGTIKRKKRRFLALPVLSRDAVVTQGNDWQRNFTGWIDGDALRRLPA